MFFWNAESDNVGTLTKVWIFLLLQILQFFLSSVKQWHWIISNVLLVKSFGDIESVRPLGRRPAGTSGWSCFRLASPQDVPPTHPHTLPTSSSSSFSLFKRIHQRMCCPPTHYHYNDRIFEMPMECLFKKDNFVLWWIFPYLDCGKSRFCRKFWSNFDSNFPNDDIVHNRMFQMSRETFSQNIPHIPDFSSSISQIIRIFPEYLWHVSPGHPEQIVAFLSKSKFKSTSKKRKTFWKRYKLEIWSW